MVYRVKTFSPTAYVAGGNGVPAATGGRGHHYATPLIQLDAFHHPLQHAHPAPAAGAIWHYQKGTYRVVVSPTYKRGERNTRCLELINTLLIFSPNVKNAFIYYLSDALYS